MRNIALIAPLILALAGCQSPQEQCISSATRDLVTLKRLIGETEKNIARGYALEWQTVEDTVWGVCRDKDGGTYACWRDITRSERNPVAIDLDAERRKLASMRAKERMLTEQASRQIAQCRAQYPDA